jgi:hypothetical protein
MKSPVNKNFIDMKALFLALAIFLFGNATSFAQDTDADSCAGLKWLIPDLAVGQFAGNIGFLSGGFGYQYARDKMELQLLYGYVPEKYGGQLHIVTAKSVYIPFTKLPLCKNTTADLLTLAIPVSYTFGDEYFVVAPREQYPKRYYDYSSAIRIGLCLGGRINYAIPNSCLKEIGAYYELGTYDLLIHNYIFNVSQTPLSRIFSLGLGVRVKFGAPE